MEGGMGREDMMHGTFRDVGGDSERVERAFSDSSI